MSPSVESAVRDAAKRGEDQLLLWKRLGVALESSELIQELKRYRYHPDQ